ncbi:MAG: MlaD family protein [Phycisphaerae bacterium]
MSKKASPALVGSFVISALVLLVLGIAYIGGGRFLAKSYKYVAYFEGSLAGLTVGAPVTFRGVRVGEVFEIVVRYDIAEDRIRTPVYVEFQARSIQQASGEPCGCDELIRMLVDRGLKAQLTLQSLVTGQLAVELDLRPDKPLVLVGKDPRYPELPTVPSAMEQITKTLQNLPIHEIVEDLRSAIKNIDQLASSPELHKAVKSLGTTLEDVGNLARHIDSKVDPVVSSVEDTADAAKLTLQQASESIASVEQVLKDTLEDIRVLARDVDDQVDPVVSSFESAANAAVDALGQARATLATVQSVIAEDSRLHYEVVNALEELSAAARAVRVLADYLEQHPESLIRGKGAPGER